MGFRLVLKWVTLNDLERHNGPHFALFHQIFVYDVVIKQLLGIHRFQNLLLIVHDHIKTICSYSAIIWAKQTDNSVCCKLLGVGA